MRSWFSEISFANPELFWLLLLVPIFWLYYFFYQKRFYGKLRFSNLQPVVYKQRSWREYLVHAPLIIRSLGISLLIIALARPQTMLSREEVSTEGIDIVLAMDISSSMLAQDFKPNRLESAKEVAKDFIDARGNDRIGLVVFSGESFTQTPITTDHKVVKEQLDKLESGLVEDGTAIGMGLATAVDRLKDSEAKSKVIILLTDGVNNQGVIDPKTAAEIASSLNVRVYTIGVGSEGTAPYPFQDQFGRTRIQNIKVEIDEELLQYIAELTGVAYYRATDQNSLSSIFAEIDKLEKTRIQVASFKRYSEEFLPFALIAIFLLLLEFIMSHFLLRKIP